MVFYAEALSMMSSDMRQRASPAARDYDVEEHPLGFLVSYMDGADLCSALIQLASVSNKDGVLRLTPLSPLRAQEAFAAPSAIFAPLLVPGRLEELREAGKLDLCSPDVSISFSGGLVRFSSWRCARNACFALVLSSSLCGLFDGFSFPVR
jgi:hypothetical protein